MSWLGGRLWSWLGGDQVVETFQEQVTRWASIVVKYAGLAIQIALFVPASISLFFVGLFLSVGGLDYLLLIDKSSMLASLFIYTAVLSSVTMIVTFIPRLVTSNGLFVGAARALGLVGFSIYIIGLEHTVLLAVLAGCMLLWALLRQRRNGPLREVHRNLDLLKVGASALLFCCLAFGYLRGEHLRERPPSMVVHLVDAQTPVPVTVIMSSDQGVLVFQPPDPVPRFYPWNRISRMASAPEHRGISQSLRDWLHAARGWIGGIPATVRGWMGW